MDDPPEREAQREPGGGDPPAAAEPEAGAPSQERREGLPGGERRAEVLLEGSGPGRAPEEARDGWTAGPGAAAGPESEPGEPPEGAEEEEPARRVPGPRLVRLACLFYGALAAVALLWRTGWAGESILYASQAAARSGIDPLGDVAIGLLTGGAVVWLSREITRRTRAGRELARALAEALGPITIPQALVLAILSGVAEEAFFRGALQPQVGLAAASLLFGLVHFVPRRELLPWTAFSVAAGFLLGGLFELTGNLVAPVLAHFTVNAVNLPMVTRSYRSG